MRLRIDTKNHKEFLTMVLHKATNPGAGRDVQHFLITLVEAVLSEEGPTSDITIRNRLTPGTFKTGDSKKTVPGYLWNVDIQVKDGQPFDGHCYLRTDDDDMVKRLYLEDSATEWQEEIDAPSTLQ